MKAILDWLSGKKTYLTTAAGIVTAVAAFSRGELTLGELATAVLLALGVAGLRAGVAKVEKKL